MCQKSVPPAIYSASSWTSSKPFKLNAAYSCFVPHTITTVRVSHRYTKHFTYWRRGGGRGALPREIALALRLIYICCCVAVGATWWDFLKAVNQFFQGFLDALEMSRIRHGTWTALTRWCCSCDCIVACCTDWQRFFVINVGFLKTICNGI